MIKFNKNILPNGLRVITVPMKDNPTVTVMVLVEAGSKYETKEINGISHFLEHMCFKGTDRRPKAIDISKELDGVGAHYNAFTGQEFTGYYAKSDFRHLDKILDVVSDIYLNSTLPESEIEKEKGVIIEEINMYEDLPQRKVQDVFNGLLYGDTPAGWDIAGTKENVNSFKRNDLSVYREKHYVAEATSIVVAGNFDEKKILPKISNIFSGTRQSRKFGKEKVAEKQENPVVRLSFKETDQAHFVLGLRTFDTYDKRNHILRVLSAILGGGMSSRLFQRIREEMGAGYYIGASAEAFTDHGFFEVAGGVDQKRMSEVVKAVLEELKKLKMEKVSVAELRKTKDYLIGSMYLNLETSDSLADFYGYQEIMKKPIKTEDEIVALVESVSSADVKGVADYIFDSSKLNLAIIGRYKDQSEFASILKI